MWKCYFGKIQKLMLKRNSQKPEQIFSFATYILIYLSAYTKNVIFFIPKPPSHKHFDILLCVMFCLVMVSIIPYSLVLFNLFLWLVLLCLICGAIHVFNHHCTFLIEFFCLVLSNSTQELTVTTSSKSYIPHHNVLVVGTL